MQLKWLAFFRNMANKSSRSFRVFPSGSYSCKMISSAIALFFVLGLLAIDAGASIQLPAIISDGMVLQQKSSVPLWGKAEPGATVAVSGSWMKKAVMTQADQSGSWKVTVKTPAAGGPFTLVIKGKETVRLKDVWIGEVWLCSGQSNMEMPVSGWPGAPVLRSDSVIQNARNPKIRMFTVKKKIALKPQSDCEGSWSATTPQTVGSFSATAYFFAQALYNKLKVPIGLIHSSWGGTVAEAWTSRDALRKLGGFDPALDHLEALAPQVDALRAEDERNLRQWTMQIQTVKKAFAAADFADEKWPVMQLPTKWEQAGHADLDGIVWFRKTVTIPEAWAGKDIQLDLGPIDDEDISWFNGRKVGATQGTNTWAKPRSYIIPGKLVKAGKNVIAVRVMDRQGDGGIYGKADQMRLAPVGAPNQGISLAGDWHYKIAAVKPKAKLSSNPNTPTVLFNGMIAPVLPFAIRGAIWYQGEANVGRAAQYARLFPAMIKDWRDRWMEGDFPFYFVQIAPYPYGGNGRRSAALREAQRLSLRVPSTGMAVTLDIGDTTNIHPANKEEVGRRLALWALVKAYGMDDIPYSGPLYTGIQAKGNRLWVSFRHAAGGLQAIGGSLDYFEVAGADGHFVPAKAAIKGEQVVVWSDKIAHPKAVRYAWQDKAVPHLFNQAGLPASTFSSLPLQPE